MITIQCTVIRFTRVSTTCVVLYYRYFSINLGISSSAKFIYTFIKPQEISIVFYLPPALPNRADLYFGAIT